MNRAIDRNLDIRSSRRIRAVYDFLARAIPKAL
jgi:hypothetical protein